jgi:hypothetical protein
MREIRLSGSTSGDWKRGPIKGLPRQSSTLLNPWNTRQWAENPRVGIQFLLNTKKFFVMLRIER